MSKAYEASNRVLANEQLFTYLDSTLPGSVVRINSPIEGTVNAQPCALLRTHRRLPLLHRIKAIYWWCYLYSHNPKPVPTILVTMPTVTTIAQIYQTATSTEYQTAITNGWDSALA